MPLSCHELNLVSGAVDFVFEDVFGVGEAEVFLDKRCGVQGAGLVGRPFFLFSLVLGG